MTSALARTVGWISAALLLAVGLAGTPHHVAGQSTPASNATIHLLAVDADPTGNGWTSLGPIDSCVRTEVGKEIDVDVVVDAIPADRPIMAFQMTVDYDPAVLQVTAYDQKYLLAAVGSFRPFEAFNDPLPDSDGSLDLGILDIASNDPEGANMETGPGVLARITFQAKAAGSSMVSVAFNPPDVYPLIIDRWNEVIQIDNLGHATISVGDDCPPSGAPSQITPLPSIGEILGSTPTPEPIVPGSASAGPQASPGPGDGAGPTAPSGNGAGGAASVYAPPTPVPALPDLGTAPGGDSTDALTMAGGALAALGVVLLASGGWYHYRLAYGRKTNAPLERR